MTSLRRLLGLPRLPNRIYLLILALFLVLAYIVSGAHQFFTSLEANLWHCYHHLKIPPEEKKEWLKIPPEEKKEWLKILEEKNR